MFSSRNPTISFSSIKMVARFTSLILAMSSPSSSAPTATGWYRTCQPAFVPAEKGNFARSTR